MARLNDELIDDELNQSVSTGDVLDAVIRSRRTSLLVDANRPVADSVIDELIANAVWAPNHKRTWPWSFTVISGESRARLGQAMAQTAAEARLPEAKVAKLPTKYLRSPALLLVWVTRDADDHRRQEDRDATAAAVQNILLSATARGLANYWATVPDVLMPAVRATVGAAAEADLVALIYLGWPTDDVAIPVRPVPSVTRLR